jgi:hypothetical protein
MSEQFYGEDNSRQLRQNSQSQSTAVNSGTKTTEVIQETRDSSFVYKVDSWSSKRHIRVVNVTYKLREDQNELKHRTLHFVALHRVYA